LQVELFGDKPTLPQKAAAPHFAMTSQDFDPHVRDTLQDLERDGLLRHPRTVLGAQGPEIQLDGRTVLGFCSNNYLGLADDPRIAHAASQALLQHGTGAGASRHISGTSTLHIQAEARLARYVGAPAALFFSSGYAANVGTLQALVGEGDVIFSDALNHASLIDGARLSRATVFVYRHLDVDHLRELLAQHRHRYRAALVVSESVFSMEGDLGDMPTLRALADQHQAGIFIDEAHALGVLGPSGRGLCARDSVRPDVLVGTLGKAFGSSGAFASGAAKTVQLIANRARSYVFSTAPLPAVAAAASVATDLVEAADDRRSRVLAHAAHLRSGLQALGYSVPAGQTPIIPVLIGSSEATMALSAALLAHGVFVHGIRPPTVPANTCRLRLTPIATHTDAHLENVLAAFKACQKTHL